MTIDNPLYIRIPPPTFSPRPFDPEKEREKSNWYCKAVVCILPCFVLGIGITQIVRRGNFITNSVGGDIAMGVVLLCLAVSLCACSVWWWFRNPNEEVNAQQDPLDKGYPSSKDPLVLLCGD